MALPKTLILSPRQCEDSRRLKRAAQALGWRVVRWPSWQLPQGFSLIGETVLYASPLFAERVSQLLPLKFLEPPDDWLTRLPQSLTMRKIEATTLAEARKKQERAFYKPAAFKSFPAAVYDSGKELPGEDKADQDQLVLISEVVSWESEFRFFLKGGKALTGSVYFRRGESAADEGAWTSTEEELNQAKRMAEEAFAQTSSALPESVVIDTGYIEGRGWAVIEANPSWGSGLYGCDEEAVLRVLESSATK